MALATLCEEIEYGGLVRSLFAVMGPCVLLLNKKGRKYLDRFPSERKCKHQKPFFRFRLPISLSSPASLCSLLLCDFLFCNDSSLSLSRGRQSSTAKYHPSLLYDRLRPSSSATKPRRWALFFGSLNSHETHHLHCPNPSTHPPL